MPTQPRSTQPAGRAVRLELRVVELLEDAERDGREHQYGGDFHVVPPVRAWDDAS
ncbi:MAG: hypothetical protein MUD07_09295 [Burkholderiaceae bacterium]|nr:hypothetical protein [Burkholderiaceae bacterium]